MQKRFGGRLVVVAMATALFGLGVPTGSAAAADDALNMYSATVSAEQFGQLRAEGYDVVDPQPTADGVAVDLVLSQAELTAVEGKGVDAQLLRTESGDTIREAARAQARGGFDVWRDYDGSDGLRQYLTEFEAEHERIAKLKVIGQTLHGRDIVAMRLTKESRGKGRKGHGGSSISDRPAVLYQGTTHAREWISTEVTRRLMEHFAGDSPAAKKMRKKRRLWFIPVVNPDGYQYTFDHERLWRRNLRDNDGDGQLTNFDGVDLNRNYPEHWNYDDEGSNSSIASDTYRGTGPASEPETRASIEFVRKIDPVLADSYHSYGPLLLYPEGWQIQTPARDLPIYLALSGNDANPAVEGTDPDVSAELYTTNGEFTDWAHHEQGVLAWTSELNPGCPSCGFVFPDDEALVQREFQINLPFAVDMARSAGDPARPDSHLGNSTEPFYLELVSEDPTFANNPLADFRFGQSYGDPQPVDILARNSLSKVRLNYRINGGTTHKVDTDRWEGGETYGEGYDTYYGVRRGEVTGTDPGDSVEVWFTGKEKKGKKGKGAKKGRKVTSDSFTYDAVSESGAGALVVAAEDYTGASPTQEAGPHYLGFYTRALNRNGIAHDVYDVDAAGRLAPDHLGVLSHYDAVIWYTGDDVITRENGMVPGTASRLANDEMLEMRAYMNEGGNLLYTGKNAGVQYQNLYSFDPVANEPCGAGDDTVTDRCQTLSDDFLQYYLGAYIYNDGGGFDHDAGEPFPVLGVAAPFANMDWELAGGTGAPNQDWASSLVTTSTILPEDEYPQFASDAPAQYDRGAGPAPFEPIDGSRYLYSQRADESYKRLTRSFDLSGVAAADNPALQFKMSYDAEPAWDHLIIEAHTPGQDDWTTLPAPTHTTPDPGESCPSGWTEDLHLFLRHYQTLNANGTCSPTGTEGTPPGEWNSATGRSAGWEQWDVDLSDYAGQQVELSISYVSDYSVQGLGVFLDDIVITPGSLGGTTSFEDDADPFDGWAVTGAPAGSNPNPNDWERTGSVGIEEGAVVATDDSLFFGFGFEGIADAGDRRQVMANGVEYLLNSP